MRKFRLGMLGFVLGGALLSLYAPPDLSADQLCCVQYSSSCINQCNADYDTCIWDGGAVTYCRAQLDYCTLNLCCQLYGPC
jgi:hypothetical protein